VLGIVLGAEIELNGCAFEDACRVGGVGLVNDRRDASIGLGIVSVFATWLIMEGLVPHD
jgi:hypothetical protein